MLHARPFVFAPPDAAAGRGSMHTMAKSINQAMIIMQGMARQTTDEHRFLVETAKRLAALAQEIGHDQDAAVTEQNLSNAVLSDMKPVTG